MNGSRLPGESVYKGFSNQTQDFIDLTQKKYDNNADNKMESYINFFKKLAIAVKTENKVFISHAGPSHPPKSEDDIKNISENDYSHNLCL